MSESQDAFEQEQEDAAAAEAASIGGRVSDEPPSMAELEMDEAERPVSEGGGGVAEGFELSEVALEEHASHGDEHAARRVLEDAALLDEGETADPQLAGEADTEAKPDA